MTLEDGGADQRAAACDRTDATFINDAVATKRAVYFTDSQRPVLYKVALSSHRPTRGC